MRISDWSSDVCSSDLVDLRQLHRGDPWDDLWHDWREDWRHLKFDLHIEPPSWVLGDMALEARLSGIVFPSLTHEGGANIVAYVGKLATADRIAVNDPDALFPKDRSSWVGRSEERRVGSEYGRTFRDRWGATP